MDIFDLFLVLVGHRDAIDRCVSCLDRIIQVDHFKQESWRWSGLYARVALFAVVHLLDLSVCLGPFPNCGERIRHAPALHPGFIDLAQATIG